MAATAEALQIAMQHHQAGSLQVAEQMYRQILQVEPEPFYYPHFQSLGNFCNA